MVRKAAGSIPRDPTVIHDGEIMGKVAFKLVFDDFLRRMEPIAPHTKVRDLAVRIEKGMSKLGNVRAAGKMADHDPRIIAAEDLILSLQAERLALYREWIIPHYVMHSIWLILDQSEDKSWPITAVGVIAVKLPGILTVTVQVQTEPPF